MPTNQDIKTFIIPVRRSIGQENISLFVYRNYKGNFNHYYQNIENGTISRFEVEFQNDKYGLEIIENALTKEIILNEVLLSDRTKKTRLFIVPTSEVSNFKNAMIKGGRFKYVDVTESERAYLMEKGVTSYTEGTTKLSYNNGVNKNYAYLPRIADPLDPDYLIPRSEAKKYLCHSILK